MASWMVRGDRVCAKNHPLGFAVPREEFFIESYVAFRINASCGLFWGPLDGEVDGLVLEVFVDVADIAGASYH